MHAKSRFDHLDWLVATVLVALIVAEWSQLLGILNFGFGVGPTLLVSLFILGGVSWVGYQQPVQVNLGKAEAIILIGSAIVSGSGILGMVSGLAFASIVALGYLLVFLAAYALYRMENPFPKPEGAIKAVSEMPLVSSELLAKLPIIDILQDLTPEELQVIGAIAQPMHVSAGTQLAQADQTADSIYLIFDGEVELYATSAMGEATVRVAGPGESFPLAALLGSGRLITSARAMSDAYVAVIPVVGLRNLCT